MKILTRVLLCACAVGIFPYAEPAKAASFNCSKASSPRDRLICRTPALSDLDSRLGETYEARKALLSSEGAELLKKSQLSWLRFVYTVCAVTGNAKIANDEKASTCIEGRYRDRLTQLEEVGRRFGPFLLNRIDLYSAKLATDESGEVPGFYVRHVAYPQIDRPTRPSAFAWNSRQIKSLSEADFSYTNDDDNSDSDDERSYYISFVNDHVLSMLNIRYSYSHGSPHGMGTDQVESIVLPDFRSLAVEDIFDTNLHALPALLTLFREAYSKEGWPPAGAIAPENIEAAERKVIDSNRWLLTTDGLQVPFSPYEVGCYVCSPPLVTIPWSDLKPLLSPKSLVP